MKNVLTSISAVLLVVWYSLSVIGFDVHTCSGSGKTYIATFVSGFTCADIHPEHANAGCRCCDSHKEDTSSSRLDRKPCCADDYQVILLTGVRVSQQDDKSCDSSLTILQHDCDNWADNSYPTVFLAGLRAFYKPRSGDLMPRKIREVYNIWRI